MNAACIIGEREESSPIVRERTLFGVCGLIFAVSVAVTAVWCGRMSAMDGLPMSGGWTLSMMWMRMPGQTWPGAEASFLGMWGVMMTAMMIPSLVPMLLRYRAAVAVTNDVRRAGLTVLVGAGYFFVWAMLGVAVFPLGVGMASLEMKVPAMAREVPSATGAVVLFGGLLQFTRWKARHLTCCRESVPRNSILLADERAAWRHGLSLGLHCTYCCAGLTAILLVTGVMDLRAMAVVTGAITAERVAPRGERIARALGVVFIVAGAFLIVRSGALG